MATKQDRQFGNMKGQKLRNVADPTEDMDVVNKRYLGRIVVRKSLDETVNNSVALQNDDELFFPIGANEIWSFQMYIRNSIKAASDYKFTLIAPSGATGGWHFMSTTNGTAEFAFGAVGTTSVSSDTTDVVKIMGVAINGGTGGNIQFKWAQNIQVAENTKVLANSYIIATKLN